MPGRLGRGRLSFTLLAMAAGYALLVAGPLWNARGAVGRLLGDLASTAHGLPQPLVIGFALLGAAALIAIVARQVRDVELRPYGSIAPVLTVFSGLVHASLRAELPFPNVSGAQLGLSGLTLALLGGVLVGRREFGARLLGWALAALPTFALMLALTAARGDGDPIAMFRAVDAPLRAYLALLAVSSFALALVGQFAHFLSAQQPAASVPPMLRIAPNATTPLNLRAPAYASQPMRRSQYDSPAAFAAAYVPGSYAQQAYGHSTPTLSLDDPDLLALTRKPSLARFAWVLMAALGLAAVGGYFLVIKPERERVAAQERAHSLRQLQARADQAAKSDDALTDRMSRYLQERQQERIAAAPVVTSLDPAPAVEPTPVEQALAPRVEEPKAERRHHHRRHARREAAVVEKAEPKAEPKAKIEKPKVEAKPEAKPAKPAPKSQNERELDLDELLEKGLKGGGKNHGSDDPILGL